MVNKILFCFLVSLLIIPLAIAVQTEITILAGPEQEITVNLLNPLNSDLIISLVGNSSSDGKAIIVYESDYRSIDIYVVARKYGDIVKYKRFEGYRTGVPITLELIEKKVENITENASAQNTTSIINDTDSSTLENKTIETEGLDNKEKNESSKLTGFSISETIKENSKTIYITLTVIAVLVLGFFVFRKIKNSDIGGGFVIKKFTVNPENREIADTEKKLAEIQQEINDIKNRKTRFQEVEKRFLEAKKELDSLRRGG